MRSLAKKDNSSFFEKHEKSLVFCFFSVALTLFLLFSFLVAEPLNPVVLIQGV